MSYPLNRTVAGNDFLRSRTTDSAHVARLRERRETLAIGNVLVDVPNLLRRRFLCDTRQCLRVERKDGRPIYRGSCCTDLLVEITPPEQERLKPLARETLERSPNGSLQLAALARRIAGDDFLAWTGKQEPVLGSHASGRCVLSFINPRGRLWCGVNAMCRALGRRVQDYKPDACYAYPLHYVDYEPGRWFLTIICRGNYRMMGGAREAAVMACLETPMENAPPAYMALRGEIEHLWGEAFWQELARQAERLDQNGAA